MFLVRAFIAVGLWILIPFKTDTLGITFLLPLLRTLPFVLCPLLVIVVRRHVGAGTVVRTPLQSRTSLGALDPVPDLGAPPALSFVFLAILCGILLILAFAFATSL